MNAPWSCTAPSALLWRSAAAFCLPVFWLVLVWYMCRYHRGLVCFTLRSIIAQQMIVNLIYLARLVHAFPVFSSWLYQNSPLRHCEFIYISMTCRAQDSSSFPRNLLFYFIFLTPIFVIPKPCGRIRSRLCVVLLFISFPDTRFPHSFFFIPPSRPFFSLI